MLDFFNDMLFHFLIFLRMLPAFAVAIVVLYFVIKAAVKKGLQEYQDSSGKKGK